MTIFQIAQFEVKIIINIKSTREIYNTEIYETLLLIYIPYIVYNITYYNFHVTITMPLNYRVILMCFI